MSFNRLITFKLRTNLLLNPKRNAFKLFGSKSKSNADKKPDEGIYVMFPDIPSDTPLTNELLNLPTGLRTTKFSKLNKEQCVKAVAKTCIEFESCIGLIEQQLEENKFEKLSDFIEQIESKLVLLDYTLSTLNLLRTVDTNNFDFNDFDTFYAANLGAKAKRFKSEAIYHFMRELDAESNLLDAPQKRVVGKYLLEGKLNGLQLSSKQLIMLKEMKKEIETQLKEYIGKLNEATDRFRRAVDSPSMLRVLPDGLIATIGGNSTSVFNSYMELCADRDVRHNLWTMYYSRSSPSLDIKISNSINIDKVCSLRRRMAKLFGYDNYAHLSMQTKMTQNLETIQNTISMLKSKSDNTFNENLNELTEFAQSSGSFGATKLELWDIPYWKREFIKSKYPIEESATHLYFPLESVLNGMFEFVHKLFSVKIEEVDDNQFDSWDKDVKLYKIILADKGAVALFYMDAFARPNSKRLGSSMQTQLLRCESLNTQPITHFVLNFPQQMLKTIPVQLTFSQVLSLFEHFGYILQNSINMMPYAEISGLNNIEWDAVHMFSKFLRLWPLNSYKVIADCSSPLLSNDTTQLSGSSHLNNKLSIEQFQQLRKAHCQFSIFNFKQELYKSALDLALYTSDSFWRDINKSVWEQYMSPFTINKTEAHPCMFNDIISGPYASSYYSFIWSEMLAADVFSAFKDIDNQDDDELNKIGLRLRDSFLLEGGGCSGSEAFRQFMGRDPSPDSFLKLNGYSV